METAKGHGAGEEFNLPEWETGPRHRREKHIPIATRGGFKDRVWAHFNRIMPAHRKYCGLSRKLACIVVLAISIAILVLIIGLAAGLSHRSKYVRVAGPLTLTSAKYGLQQSPVASSGITNLHRRPDLLRPWTRRLRSHLV